MNWTFKRWNNSLTAMNILFRICEAAIVTLKVGSVHHIWIDFINPHFAVHIY